MQVVHYLTERRRKTTVEVNGLSFVQGIGLTLVSNTNISTGRGLRVLPNIACLSLLTG